jgi:hypothetical protein
MLIRCSFFILLFLAVNLRSRLDANARPFLTNGRFLYDSKKDETQLLCDEKFQELVESGQLAFPKVSEKEIMDRSKAGAFSKGVVLPQTLWFIAQCGARGAQHLPLTQLELATLAFASLNSIMYFFWWYKPLDVQCAIRIPIVSAKEKADMGQEVDNKSVASADKRMLSSTAGGGDASVTNNNKPEPVSQLGASDYGHHGCICGLVRYLAQVPKTSRKR